MGVLNSLSISLRGFYVRFNFTTEFHFQGIDSSLESMEVMEAANTLAHSSGAIVIVSGAVDIITDGHQVVGARNGVPMIQKITATGRDVTALMLHLLLSIRCML
ncbi:hypothetical protein OIU76_017429 [Salix suchowensis]|nr:hypothetical protein OIU76_017429 [Salix suchowensis]